MLSFGEELEGHNFPLRLPLRHPGITSQGQDSNLHFGGTLLELKLQL